jgi:TonB family protein
MLILMLMTALAAEPPPPAPSVGSSVITNPYWVKFPGGRDFVRFYPEAARRAWLEGSATIQCHISAQGLLEQCLVIREQPAGEGFGAAALAMGEFFKLGPATRDGQAVEGGTVIFPIRFALPAQATVPVTIANPSGPMGEAVVDCRFAADQTIDNCMLVSQKPLKDGPGELALSLATKLKVHGKGPTRFHVVFQFTQ